jgi:hypothetical protein
LYLRKREQLWKKIWGWDNMMNERKTRREIELRECLVEFLEMMRVEWGDMKMSFSYSLISLYVISILMSHLYNERDREMRWLIEKDSGSRNYGFNPVLSFSLFLNLKSFLNECDTDWEWNEYVVWIGLPL